MRTIQQFLGERCRPVWKDNTRRSTRTGNGFWLLLTRLPKQQNPKQPKPKQPSPKQPKPKQPNPKQPNPKQSGNPKQRGNPSQRQKQKVATQPTRSLTLPTTLKGKGLCPSCTLRGSSCCSYLLKQRCFLPAQAHGPPVSGKGAEVPVMPLTFAACCLH